MTTDALIAVRCQLGEAEAFDELVARFHPALCQYARRLTGNDDAAADAVQDVWLRVLRGLQKLREPERLRSWLFGVAHRTLMDRLRAQYRRVEITNQDLTEVPGDVEDPGPEEDAAALDDALGRLPILEREVLTLFYLRELTISEIGDVQGVPAGTVKSRLFRARALLRTELQKGNPHEA